MSEKVYDKYNRWRNKIVAFRASPEENEQLDRFVALSGMTKQNYILSRLLCKDIVIVGNPRVYKALKKQMEDLYQQLLRISQASEVSDEFLELLQFVAEIYCGMKDDSVLNSDKSAGSETRRYTSHETV